MNNFEDELKDYSTIDENFSETENINFEDAFFERSQNGEKNQHFLTLSSQQDAAVLRSLFLGSNIPSYCEGERSNNIYGGLSGTMTAVVGIKVYILTKDYDAAYEILVDFINDKLGKVKKEKKRSIFTRAFERSISTYPINSKQEILGMTILPKTEDDE